MRAVYRRMLTLFVAVALASMVGGASCAADAKYNLQAGAMDFVKSSMSQGLQTAFPVKDMLSGILHPG